MSISGLYIRNLSLTRTHSMDYKLDDDRQIRGRIAPGARSADLSALCTPDELNRLPIIQEERAAGRIEVESTAPTAISSTVPGNIPQIVSAAEILSRSGAPILDRITGQTVSIAAVPEDKAVVGRNLLQGGSHASVVFGTGTSSVTVTALRPGEPSEAIAVALVDAASASVSVSGGAVTGEPSLAAPRTITVNFRGANNSNTDNANAVAALINASASANRLVRATGGGTGNVTASAAQNLAGGVGSGFRAFMGGVEQNVQGTAGVTNTSLPLETIATGGANGDRAMLYVVSNGVRSNDFPVDVVT